MEQIHKSLYRVYRPKVFDEVLGQKLIATALKNAINENKIAHAYLFAGSSGVGKTSLAKIFAKAVNCIKENKPCLECDVCQLIHNNKTTDVIEMDAASNNGIDEIKNLIENVKYPPLECEYKVYIIDEVHMLSSSAFNALLKTLEEPPAKTIFILATTEEHKVPETILTRCQKFYFLKVADQEIVKLLEDIAKQENKEYDKQALELIAEMANGGVRLAISIFEKCISLPEKLTINVVNKTYGLLSKEEVKELCEAIYNKDQQAIFVMFNKINNLSSNYLRIAEEILSFLKEVLISSINQDYNFKFINKNDDILLDEKFIYDFINLIKNSMQEMRFANSPKLLFEILILEALKFNEEMKPSKVKKIGKNQEEKTSIVEKNLEVNKTKEKPQKIKKIPTQTGSLFASDNNVDEVSEDKKDEKQAKEIKESKDEKIQEKITTKDIPENEQPKEEQTKHIEDDILSEIKSEKEALIEDINKQPIEEEPQEQSKEKKEEIASEHIKLENEIINVLLKAERKYKEFFKTKWENLDKYLDIPENARWINMIHNSKIAAATDNVIILLFEYEPSANILNDENKNQKFLNLMYQIFEKDVLFLGIWVELWEKIKSDFVYKKNNNKLPKYVEIFVPKTKLEVNKKDIDQDLKNINDLFGEDVVKEVE